MPDQVFVILGIIAAGIVGCVATGLMLRALTGRPASVVAGNWRKHAWSIIFAAPMPFLLALPLGNIGNTVVTLAWLALAPSVASKLHFGPKDAPWSRLLALHGAFAVAALLTFLLVVHIPLMLGL